ncbi:MAG: DNA polymerase III subunit alpha [Actinomycetota bacterium]
MSFVHLHSHSEYSLLDGASRIKQMFERAKALGMPALALTDHGAMYGAIPFFLEGKAAGVKPLIGMEAYVAPKSRFDKPAQREDWYHHLTLIAANKTGYHNLIKLSSLGFTEGYDSRSRRPRVDRELLGKHCEGIVALSGCLSGKLPKTILAGDRAGARVIASEYREIFGDRYFLEMQDHGITEQAALNVEIAAISKELGIPLVATNDSHYTHKEDASAHDILLCIQTGKMLSDTKRMKFDTEEFYLKTPAEMAEIFAQYPGAVENTLAVAEMCEVDIDLYKLLLPVFETPPGETLGSYLRKLTEEGIRRRYQPVTPVVDDRVDMELKVIEEMGYSGYFLVVSDFVQWAKNNGIRVGPGRGSVGGSIVAYALGITELDPLRWKLGFERFLNPGRKSMPDIDIDFDERRRNEVIRYVSQKYGEDRVAQIITFSTIKAKAAIRDAARVLGLPYSVGDKLAKMYPPSVLGKEPPFAACFESKYEWPANTGKNDAYPNATELRKMYETEETSREVIDTARKLEGLRRQHSVHAAGVVISDQPITNHAPVQKTDGEVVTQYEMGAIEQIGLLKMDFLGLRNLTVIGDALDHIKNNRGESIDIEGLALDDAASFKLLTDGHSAGIFQMESGGMTRLCRRLRPDRFEEIAALIALYRPGPMEEIGRYVKGKHDPSSITYFHSMLEGVLGDTNGVIVYQEQVTEMLQHVAGFSPQDADMVRYAIGKKKSHELVKWKGQFAQGCKASGLTDIESKGLWDLILPFAGYSFNRAHANGYGLIAYQTAWLKAHYPVEYMAALLTSAKDRVDKMPIYLAECRTLGIEVLPPNVNESGMDFTPRGKQVLFGLSAIRNVGEAVAERIIAARETKGDFTGFGDFCKKADPSCLNKKVVESLARAGAFDCLKVERCALLTPDPKNPGSLCISEQAARSIEAIIAERRSEDAGQFSLFGGGSDPASTRTASNFQSILTGIEISKAELLRAEKEMLGFYVSEHPLAAIESALLYQAECKISELAEASDGAIRTVGGILTRVIRKFTKKGDLWLNAMLEDMESSVEVNIWPRTVEETDPTLLVEDTVVLIKGRVEIRDDHPILTANRFKRPDFTAKGSPLRIKIPAGDCTPGRIEELKTVLSSHPGPSPVLLHLAGTASSTILKLGGGYTVEQRSGLYAEIKSVLGPAALVE